MFRFGDLRAVLRLVVLTGSAGLLLWAVVPYAVGWRTTLVVSGSMEPTVRTGDLVVVAPVPAEVARDGAVRGAVLQVENPARPGELLLHRAIDRDEQGGIITKGDANRRRDHAPVRPDQVLGMARLRIPLAGLPVLWLRGGQLVPLGALALALLVLAWPETRRPSTHASISS